MELKNAISVVRQELVNEGGMLHRIAQREGIDLEAASRLEEALKTLVAYYKDKNEVPKNWLSPL